MRENFKLYCYNSRMQKFTLLLEQAFVMTLNVAMVDDWCWNHVRRIVSGKPEERNEDLFF
jgi:hypothetical protein